MTRPPVVAPCLACKGRCVAHDIVHEIGSEIISTRLHRTICPMCQGRGVLDYANLPLKKDEG